MIAYSLDPSRNVFGSAGILPALLTLAIDQKIAGNKMTALRKHLLLCTCRACRERCSRIALTFI
jgi:hypothetical protein